LLWTENDTVEQSGKSLKNLVNLIERSALTSDVDHVVSAPEKFKMRRI